MAVKHGNESHLCSQCPKVFKSEDSLKYHESKVHTVRKMFQCDQCDKLLKTKESMAKHIIDLHTPESEKPFICE